MDERPADRTEPARGNGATGRGLMPGSVFAGLEVEAEVGRGGMGVIYRARDRALEQVRALKVLGVDRSDDPKFRERFRRESRLAASIEHPNVAPIHQAGEHGGRLYIVMRFVDGPSLKELLTRRGRLEPSHAAALVLQIAAALDAAHAHGLIHRDVKPANVLLEGPEGEERAFLCDFGISKLASAGTDLTSTGQFLGTVDYVAPEQISGDPVDPRTDVYSLACVLYHGLTGSPPFSRETQLATMFAHAHQPRPLASEKGPDLPRALDPVLVRGMAQRPADRYASAGEFASDVVEALGESGSKAVTHRLPKATRARRRPTPLLVAGALALVAVAVAAIALSRGGSSGQEAPPVETAGTIDVPRGPVALTVGTFRVWVVSPSKHLLSSIAPVRKRVDTQIPIGGAPSSVAFGFRSVWVADRSNDRVIEIEPRGGTVEKNIPVGDQPLDIAVSNRWVWVANRGDDTVSQIDPRTNEVRRSVAVGSQPSAIAAAPFAVWVVNLGNRTVSKINTAAAATVGRPISVGQAPTDLAVGRGSLWVVDNFNGTLTRIDPESMHVVGDPIGVSPKPRSVSVGLGSVWVGSGEEGAVDRVDPHTGDVVGSPTPVGETPRALDVSHSAVWVANFGDSTVTKLKP
jgi:YVTN family beta-propeller protein